jgi:hypothetical protein
MQGPFLLSITELFYVLGYVLVLLYRAHFCYTIELYISSGLCLQFFIQDPPYLQSCLISWEKYGSIIQGSSVFNRAVLSTGLWYGYTTEGISCLFAGLLYDPTYYMDQPLLLTELFYQLG